ncbi:MAG: nucleotidyltransferase domain-containing protein [Actinobacteria bacterium]|nr:nucleotidyltransferase domain-containing protein [Actinomycetota bacterium]
MLPGSGSAETRGAEGISALLDGVAAWAAQCPGVGAVALVGSYAGGRARPDSDVDLVVLATDPAVLLGDRGWLHRFGAPESVAVESWGAVTSLRVHYTDGLEVEWGLAAPLWAAVDPLDPGTARVVAAGLRPLYDPDGLLARLSAAVAVGGC